MTKELLYRVVNGCISRRGREIDGLEFDVKADDFIDFLETNKGKEMHINFIDSHYSDGEYTSSDHIDLWLKVQK